MARPQSRQKLGYYPTPDRVADLVRTFLGFPPDPFSVLDPCCGEGTALAQLTANTAAVTYGIEIHGGRAKAARRALNHALSCGYEEARVSHASASLLFLNPPYDDDAHEETEQALRTERRFLRDTHPYLVPGGTLVYLIPQRRLDPPTARLLSTWFEQLTVWRFPDPEFQAFSQIAVFGIKKARGALDDQEQERLAGLVQTTLPPLEPAAAPFYLLPPTPPILLFRSTRPDPDLLAQEVRASAAWRDFWESQRRLNGAGQARPPLPLHVGHLGLLLAAGELDGVIGEGPERHLVRGLVRKEQISWTEKEQGRLVEHTKDIFRIRVKLLFPDGTLRTLEDSNGAPDTKDTDPDESVPARSRESTR